MDMPPANATLRKWWPTTQSIDLVKGPIRDVAEAVSTEFRRFSGDADIVGRWTAVPDLDAVFSSAPHFANVVTFIAVLPTCSEWVGLWNNSFLCDGYDALCWNLTRTYRHTTMHWSAHDDSTTFQPGVSFTHRAWRDGGVGARSVACIRQDRRWLFEQAGEPLPEEDVSSYLARRTQDRLDEVRLMKLLAKLGADPWSGSFYAVPAEPVFLLSRPLPPRATTRSRQDVLRPPSS